MPSKSKRDKQQYDDLEKFIQELTATKKKKKANAPISVESRMLAEEDRGERVERSNATSGMKHGGKVKGHARGYKSGGKIRGYGIAQKGTRKAKMR